METEWKNSREGKGTGRGGGRESGLMEGTHKDNEQGGRGADNCAYYSDLSLPSVTYDNFFFHKTRRFFILNYSP